MKGKGRLYMVKGCQTERSEEGSSSACSARARQSAQMLTALRVNETGTLSNAWQSAEQRVNGLLEDRQRIARDLHDCVLQSLYGLGLTLEKHRRVNSRDEQSKPEGLIYGIDQINKLIGEVRRMVRGLEEGTIQPFNLLSELESLVVAYENATDIKVELQLESSAVEALTQEEEHELFNIIREALSNCVRHAKARHITITLSHTEERVFLRIQDDGIGFNAKQQAKGYGLFNMTARVQKLGGTLLIHSETGQGTTITADIRLEPMLTPL